MANAPTLYHCPQTRATATFWMNEELGAPCDIKIVDLKTGGQKTPEFLAINPMGKVPALVHNGVAVTETGAICAYLADAYADKGLAPALDSPDRGAYYRWMFFASGCIEPTMLDKLTGNAPENTGSAGHGSLEDVVASVEHALANGPYLLGETFSAADVVFGNTVNFAMMFGAFEKKPIMTDYVQRLMSRPAAQAAHEKNASLSKQLGWT
ncbi:MAG: glutathione S-transferase family protein [Lysobacterales bacterium]